MTEIKLRLARSDEIPALEQIIAESARTLSAGFYSAEETEAAIAHVFGVDSELVADGTYLVAEAADIDGATHDHRIWACGGWSKRATLFGGDRFAMRQSGLLDPETDAAKIRAFFVSPYAARKGIGAALLQACEDAARLAGFSRTELMATLPGQPFYAAYGYSAGDTVNVDCGGINVRFVQMAKTL